MAKVIKGKNISETISEKTVNNISDIKEVIEDVAENSIKEKPLTVKPQDKDVRDGSPSRPFKNYKLIFSVATEGKSNAGVKINGQEIVIELNDGIYQIDESLPEYKKEEIEQELLNQGFKDVSEYRVTQKVEKENIDNKIWVMVHPDNSKTNPITCNIGAIIEGQEVQLSIIEGLITVIDKRVFNWLSSQGYYVLSVKEKK